MDQMCWIKDVLESRCTECKIKAFNHYMMWVCLCKKVVKECGGKSWGGEEEKEKNWWLEEKYQNIKEREWEGRETERGEREILSLLQENDTLGFPGGPLVKAACFHCRGHGFHPWSRTSPHASRCGQKKERKKITPYATDKPLAEFLCLQNSTAIEPRCSAFCHTRPAELWTEL